MPRSKTRKEQKPDIQCPKCEAVCSGTTGFAAHMRFTHQDTNWRGALEKAQKEIAAMLNKPAPSKPAPSKPVGTATSVTSNNGDAGVEWIDAEIALLTHRIALFNKLREDTIAILENNTEMERGTYGNAKS